MKLGPAKAFNSSPATKSLSAVTVWVRVVIWLWAQGGTSHVSEEHEKDFVAMTFFKIQIREFLTPFFSNCWISYFQKVR